MDLFVKCREFTRAAEARASGYYPYFIPLSHTEGTEVTVDGHRLIMIGSNNYLGLTTHPKVREAAIDAVRKYGTSCTGSRFLNGTLELHTQLEEELAEFLQIPSVSTDSAHTADIRQAALWVLNKLQKLGFHVEFHETARHPVVCGHIVIDPSLPTILIYGHYDVQPPDPLDEWTTPPFSPNIRDGHIYARGATDNKGQCLTYLEAMEAMLSVTGRLPLNVKVLIEGEEEGMQRAFDAVAAVLRRALSPTDAATVSSCRWLFSVTNCLIFVRIVLY